VLAFLISAPTSDPDPLITLLWEQGTVGIEERPAPTGQVELLAYFDDAALSPREIEQALGDLKGVVVRATDVPEVDWVARFREGFRAFAAPPFWITPVWAVNKPPSGGHIPLVVDPGRAFGTGTHESTGLCLAALARLRDQRPLGRLLDVGTGSGILAIGGTRLGASRAVASDTDPECLVAAREHAALNHVDLCLVRADGGRSFAGGAFDTVLANLSTPILRAKARELAACCRRGGTLVMAGLLAEDVPEVQGACPDLGPFQATLRDGWASLAVRIP